jgi:hypothetical protein
MGKTEQILVLLRDFGDYYETLRWAVFSANLLKKARGVADRQDKPLS